MTTSNTSHDDASTTDAPLSGADIVRQFLPTSPFVGYLGIRLDDLRPDTATLTLPFAASLVTIGATVHGGAIASLIDTAAMVAAWSNATVPAGHLRGSTVSLTTAYLAPAVDDDLHATATVLRRGRSLVYLDVRVHNSSGEPVAQGLVTYKIG